MKHFAVCLMLFFYLLSFASVAQERSSYRNKWPEKKLFGSDTIALSQQINAAYKLNMPPDSSIILFRKILNSSRKINYNNGAALSLLGLAKKYAEKGEYEKSLAICKNAESYCLKADYNGGMLIIALYNNIAAIYGNQVVMDSTAFYYGKALEQFHQKQIKDTALLLLIYHNLGCALTGNNQLDQAAYYLDKGVQLAFRTKNDPLLAGLYVARADILKEQRKYDSAKSYVRKALLLASKEPFSQSIASYCTLGDIYLQEQKPQQAIKEYEKTFSQKADISRFQMVNINLGLGRAYCQLKDYNKAKQYYLAALQKSRQSKINRSMLECYDSLAAIYTYLHDYKTALVYKGAYSDLMQDIVNTDKTRALSQLEIKYRSAEKDKDISRKQLLLTRQQSEITQKNVWIGAISGGSLLLLLLTWMIYRSRKHKQDMALSKIEKEQEVNRLKDAIEGEEKERTRIGRELHDGIMVQFSVVQMNLSALIEKLHPDHLEDFDNILCQLEDATKELRKSAHNLMPDILLEEGLIEATHYFCRTLQKSARLEIDFQVYGTMPSVNAEYELMIYRIIQELVQNSIKHSGASILLLQLNCQPDLVTISVEDNGIGFNQDKVRPEKGIGLKGIVGRINSLNGTMAVNAREGKGAAFYIELETKYLKTEKDKDYASSNNSGYNR